MKNKGLVIMLITIFLILIIYIFNKTINDTTIIMGDYTINDKLSYANIIDNKKIIYSKDDNRSIDLINDIKNNILVKDKNIKNYLIKADKIIIGIGNNELFYRLNSTTVVNDDLYMKIKELSTYINNLFITIREITKEDVYFTSFYNPYSENYNTLIHYLNAEVKRYADEYAINFVDINECIKNSDVRTNYELTKEENKCIAEIYINIDK